MAEEGGDEQATSAPSGTPDVFVSYASQDATVADALVGALEHAGLKCWIAPRDVDAGALYADAIVRAIGSAKAFVLVLSAHSIVSSHVGKEVERASSKRRSILALRIDAAPLTPALEYFLSESQWIEVHAGNMDPAYAKLIGAIRKSAPTRLGVIPAVTPLVVTAPAAPPTSHRNRILLAAALTVLVIAFGALIANRFSPTKHISAEPSKAAATNAISNKSIAVLPFVDMSEKKDQEYFSDGLSEELIDMLARVPDLRVPARTSSFYFKGQHATVAEISNALGVAYILEGSVRKAGTTMRVTVQLIRADHGYHLWSETFDRDVKDVFKVQDEIAARVVAALKATLPAVATTNAGRTTNIEAHEQYLLGKSFYSQFTTSGFRRAVGAFRKAVALDPSYAAAYARLATAEGDLADRVGEPKGLQRAMAAADRAIAIAPDSADGYTARAYLRTFWL